jgi:hypothetical protein
MGLVSFDAVESRAIAADGLVKNGPGALYGFIVVASSTGNIAFYDALSATGTALIPPRAVAAGDVVTFGGLGVAFNTGLYFDLVSGTATVRPLFR